ncbi:MAG: DEAD/DEAH box helicase [Cucumibacter sp.]
MNHSEFSELGLADPIQRALHARNHIVPTPIQARAIPELMAGHDVLGIAQTGTGKTAAFALPILHRLANAPRANGSRAPRALILAPSRELAIQIYEDFRAYGRELNLRHAVIYGGVSQRPQVDAINRGIDILVATPGRLLDLMNQRRIDLGSVEFLVLDEADRMLDMGFIRDVRKIIAAVPRRRQSLMFSATMPQEITRLSAEILARPVRVEVTPQATPIEALEQGVYFVPASGKIPLLGKLLADPALSRVLVFTRTKHRANRVAEQLARLGIEIAAIHGNKAQSARQRALADFRAGKVRVLVATDIVARGIDVDSVTHVINFELPNEPEAYVHRIGRTARAGAGGIAISLCDPAEREFLSDIERLIRRNLNVIGHAPSGPASTEPRRAHHHGNKPQQAHGHGRPHSAARAPRPQSRGRRRRRAA